MKTEKKQSFRGAVLFTVVSIMSLLIVFLTSTLVLATAANNRSHKSYSSSQANYTARAAIDSVLAAIQADETFRKSIGEVGASKTDLAVKIQLDKNVTGVGKVEKANVHYEGKQKFFDSTVNEWVERELLSISVDVLYGGETKTLKAHILKNPPAKGGQGGGGGGFVTVGGAGTVNHTISFGGTYLGIGMSKGTRYYQGDYGFPTGQIVSLEDKLYLNRKDNLPGVTDVNGMLMPNLPETIDADNIVTYSMGNDCTLEAPTVINGNFYSNAQTELYIPKAGTGMAVWGNLTTQAGASSFSIKGNVDKINPTSFKDIPYLYVDSLFQGTANGSNFNVNNENQVPLNLFCGSINLCNSQMYADIYCQDSNKTSVLSGDASTSLYNWSKSVVTGTGDNSKTFKGGNFYSKGSVIVKDTNNWVTIDGDMVIEGDLEVTGKLKVTGSLVVGGTLKCNGELDVTGDIYAAFATGSKITFDGITKKAGDGSDLYTPTATIYYLLAHNVNVPGEPGHQALLYPTEEMYNEYGINIGETFHDFGNTEVDPKYVSKCDYWIGNAGDQIAYQTLWTNKNDPTDVTTNEMDIYESFVFKYNGSKNIDSDINSYRSGHNNELFPRKAEKAVILGFEEIGDGTTIEESKVLKTVEEIEDEYNFATKSITEIPAGYLQSVNNKIYSQNGGKVTEKVYSYNEAQNRWEEVWKDFETEKLPDEITESCTLIGTFNDTVKIKNTSIADIWVKFAHNTTFNKGLLYDESTAGCGNLNIFVEGITNFSTSGSGIWTQTYKDLSDSHAKFQIATDSSLYIDEAIGGKPFDCPKINIYSAKKYLDESGNPLIYHDPSGANITSPCLKINNLGIVTAAIEAPNMFFDISNADADHNTTIYYNGRELKEDVVKGYNKRIGVIGILNVSEGSMQNNWTFLYTPKDVQPYCTCVGCSCGGPICSVCGNKCKGHCTCIGSGVDDNIFTIAYYEGF